MKKSIIFMLFLSLVLLASCGKGKAPESQELSETNTAPTTVTAPADQAVLSGESEAVAELAVNYADYDASLLSESDNNVIFFHAPYCGSCTQTDKNLKETGLPEGTQVLKTDFDTSLELRKKYGVTKYHTFVQVDAEGNLIKKWGGSLTSDDILENAEVAMVKDEDAMMKKEGEVMEKEDAMMKKDEDAAMEKMEKTGEAMMDKGEDVMVKDEDAMMKKEEEVMEKEEASVGTYANYQASLVGTTDYTVLFFHANWCPSCRAADEGITAGKASIPGNLTILKADFDTQTDLRKKYGVVAQHTFVLVDGNGDEVRKWVGGTTVEDIVEKL